MINDLDETIKQLLIKRGALDPAEIDINFETPDREWSASISKPTVNIYLYDMRENHQLRSTEWTVTRDGNGNATKNELPFLCKTMGIIAVAYSGESVWSRYFFFFHKYGLSNEQILWSSDFYILF